MSRRLHVMVALAAGAMLSSCGGKQSGNGDPGSAEAAFAAMGAVITHQRCMNCHPSSDSPTQGDDMTAHQPPVFRGEEGKGAVGMECSTCHLETNTPLLERDGSMPGAASWHLAPASMGWQGKSLGEICEQIKDRSRNGDRSLEDIYKHMSEDTLVGWAWNPGAGRAAAPGTRTAFIERTREWIDNGAHCPTP